MKNTTILKVLLLFMIFFLTGCSNNSVSEDAILSDFYDENEYLTDLNININDSEVNIVSRSISDTNDEEDIYVCITGSNKLTQYELTFYMYYRKYNDGWQLESIEPYTENNSWHFTPLEGIDESNVSNYLSSTYNGIEYQSHEFQINSDVYSDTLHYTAYNDYRYVRFYYNISVSSTFDSLQGVWSITNASDEIVQEEWHLAGFDFMCEGIDYGWGSPDVKYEKWYSISDFSPELGTISVAESFYKNGKYTYMGSAGTFLCEQDNVNDDYEYKCTISVKDTSLGGLKEIHLWIGKDSICLRDIAIIATTQELIQGDKPEVTENVATTTSAPMYACTTTLFCITANEQGIEDFLLRPIYMFIVSKEMDTGLVNVIQIDSDTLVYDFQKEKFTRFSSMLDAHAHSLMVNINQNFDLPISNCIFFDWDTIAAYAELSNGIQLNINFSEEEIAMMDRTDEFYNRSENDTRKDIWKLLKNNETIPKDMISNLFDFCSTQPSGPTDANEVRTKIGKALFEEIYMSNSIPISQLYDYMFTTYSPDELYYSGANTSISHYVKINSGQYVNLKAKGRCLVPDDYVSFVEEIHYNLYRDDNYTPSSDVLEISEKMTDYVEEIVGN